ncbi:MAG: hypothetical protein IID16_12010, partial [Candidatus Marinimicrobia bacterium]|nr:hypothetical protein [Candidatus Neomarinimicrobiota bacterium]
SLALDLEYFYHVSDILPDESTLRTWLRPDASGIEKAKAKAEVKEVDSGERLVVNGECLPCREERPYRGEW